MVRRCRSDPLPRFLRCTPGGGARVYPSFRGMERPQDPSLRAFHSHPLHCPVGELHV